MVSFDPLQIDHPMFLSFRRSCVLVRLARGSFSYIHTVLAKKFGLRESSAGSPLLTRFSNNTVF